MSAAGGDRFRLVVFDWDGTLADSEARIVSTIEHAIEHLGLPPPACGPREIIGLGMWEAMAVLYPRRSRTEHERLIEAYRTRFLAAAREPVDLFPGAADVVRRLKREGFLLGVATGKSRRGLDRELGEADLGALMDATRCADEAPSKPDPTMLLEIIEDLDVDPVRTLVIGDTGYDMEMARAAGAARVGVRTGVHPAARLLESAPLAILESVAALPGFLGLDES